MTTDQPSDPAPDAPPIGLVAFSNLSLWRRLTPIIRESVYALLADRGELWTVRGQRGREVIDRALCTEQTFDAALAAFLERVPTAATALHDSRAIHERRERAQARVDRAIREAEMRKGKRS